MDASNVPVPAFMSYVVQAGVAMGLARLAGIRFPDWGPHFQTFMVSTGWQLGFWIRRIRRIQHRAFP